MGLSRYLLAFQNRNVGLWSPKKHKPTLTPVNVPLAWHVLLERGVSQGGRPCASTVSVLTSHVAALVSTGRGNHCIYWNNQSKSLDRSLSQDQPLVLQAVLGLFSSRRPSFPASFISQMFSKVALSYMEHWAPFLMQQVRSFWRQFSEGLHPVPFFLRQNDWNTWVLFIIVTGYEGAKYIGFFIVTPPFPATKSWI